MDTAANRNVDQKNQSDDECDIGDSFFVQDENNSGFDSFCAAKRKKLEEKHKHHVAQIINKELSAMWKKTSTKTKNKYKIRSENQINFVIKNLNIAPEKCDTNEESTDEEPEHSDEFVIKNLNIAPEKCSDTNESTDEEPEHSDVNYGKKPIRGIEVESNDFQEGVLSKSDGEGGNHHAERDEKEDKTDKTKHGNEDQDDPQVSKDRNIGQMEFESAKKRISINNCRLF